MLFLRLLLALAFIPLIFSTRIFDIFDPLKVKYLNAYIEALQLTTELELLEFTKISSYEEDILVSCRNLESNYPDLFHNLTLDKNLNIKTKSSNQLDQDTQITEIPPPNGVSFQKQVGITELTRILEEFYGIIFSNFSSDIPDLEVLHSLYLDCVFSMTYTTMAHHTFHDMGTKIHMLHFLDVTPEEISKRLGEVIHIEPKLGARFEKLSSNLKEYQDRNIRYETRDNLINMVIYLFEITLSRHCVRQQK